MTLLENEDSNIQTFNNSQVNNLTFIDTNLSNYQSLIPDTNNSNVVLIDAQQNGIEQITEALEKYSDLESISIFSHGDVGSLYLGNTYLSNNNLDNYQDDLAAWGNALSAEGDLLLYGCNVGGNQKGLEFVDRVADITGADVAASNDLTGNASLGGDWRLEVATGAIETATFALTEYGSLLDLKFNFTYDRGTTRAQKRAFEYAGRAWADRLSDDVTINLHVSMVDNSDLPTNTLGGAIPFFHQGTSYATFKNQLENDGTSNDDYTAVANLGRSSSDIDTNSEYDVGIPSDPSYNYGQAASFDKVAMTRANAKALRVINAHDSTLDGTIVMNNLVGTGVSWNYNYLSNTVGASKIDFTTVAIHEIGHALGFVSLVDGLSSSNYQDLTLLNNSYTSFDLFRFEENGYRATRIDQSVFSIDGNQTEIAQMSSGVQSIGGDLEYDGYQGSHWNNEDNAGIMDPLLELGVRREIAEIDLQAMDVVGWDRQDSSASKSTLWSQANREARNTGTINRNTEVGNMLEDWRWARRGSRGRLRQEGNIAQFLAQEGFFSVGSFRESFDFSKVDSAAEGDFVLVVDDQFEADQFEFSNNSDLTGSSKVIAETDVQNLVQDVVENEDINYEQIIALVTKDLSDYQWSQLNLDDLGQLIKQQLAESLVSSLY